MNTTHGVTAAAARIVLGPGPRLRGLAPMLTGLAGAMRPNVALAVEDLQDSEGLLEARNGGGRLILDVDHFSEDDIGFVRRFLANNPAWDLVLIGDDPGRRASRRLLALPRSTWEPWPPDLERLRHWMPGPAPRGAEPAPIDAPDPAAGPFGGGFSLVDPEPARPAAIRDRPDPSSQPPAERPPAPAPRTATPREPEAPGSSAPPPHEPTEPDPAPRALEALAARHLEPEAPASLEEVALEELTELEPMTETGPGLDPAARGGILVRAKDQIAHLSDIVQGLELSLTAAREESPGASASLDGTRTEMRRLLRFTRTLSHLVSPPPRGRDRFDLGPLLEEQLAALTLRGRKGPRFLPTSGGRLEVSADRSALTTALEALLTLAKACTAAGEIIRVPYGPISPEELGITVDFPRGPLEGLPVGAILEPHALRDRLPALGPNDLAAAEALVRSQGGRVRVESGTDDNVLLQIRLPQPGSEPEAPGSDADGPSVWSGEDPGVRRENDPFA